MAKKETNIPEGLSKLVNVNLRTIILPPVIGSKLYQDFDAAMSILESLNDSPISIHVCNSGGDVETAMAMVGRMYHSPCTVNTIAFGKVYSAAIYIFAAGSRRSAHILTQFMHHEHTIGGGSSTLETSKHDIEQFHKYYGYICDWLATRSLQPTSWWRRKGTQGKDFYFSAPEAIKFGICEEVF